MTALQYLTVLIEVENTDIAREPLHVYPEGIAPELIFHIDKATFSTLQR
jgi:hypothetical protein